MGHYFLCNVAVTLRKGSFIYYVRTNFKILNPPPVRTNYDVTVVTIHWHTQSARPPIPFGAYVINEWPRTWNTSLLGLTV